MDHTRRRVLAGIGAAGVFGGVGEGAASSEPSPLPWTRVRGRHLYAVRDYDDVAYLLEPFSERASDVAAFFETGTYRTYQEPGTTRVFFIETEDAYPLLVVLHGADTAAAGGKASVGFSEEHSTDLLTSHNYTGDEDGGTYLYGSGEVAGSVHRLYIDFEGEMAGLSPTMYVNRRASGPGAVPPGNGITRLQFLSNRSSGRSLKVFDVGFDGDYNALQGSVVAIPFRNR
jgi:hypothetical protein